MSSVPDRGVRSGAEGAGRWPAGRHRDAAGHDLKAMEDERQGRVKADWYLVEISKKRK